MTEPLEKPEVYVSNLKKALEEKRDLVTGEGQVPGTGLGVFDAMKAGGALRQFHRDCPKVLATGNNCTGDFNLTGGKSMKIDIGYDHGARIVIQAENGARRQVQVKPGTP